MNWLKLELKLIFSSNAARFSLSVVFISALIAIYLGDKSYQSLVEKQAFSQSTFEKQLSDYQDQEVLPSAGHLGYYLFGATQWLVNPWSALFIGQTHSAHSDLPVRALALQGQVHAQEMINPSQYKAGRLDLGFVLIYLFPLVLGVLTVTTVSEERQANRWRMFSALAQGGATFIWYKFAVCIGVVLILATLLITLAVFWLGLNFDYTYVFIVFATCAYFIFWALISALIVTLGKNSVFNTLCFMAIWLFFSVLAPASIQLYLDNRFDTQPALSATLEQRMVMNLGWDKPPKEAFTEFTKVYPEFKSFELPDGAGSWPWYYAQQHVSDLTVNKHWREYKMQAQQKRDTLSAMSWVSPSLLLQLSFNNLAGSSGQAHFNYVQDVAGYHQEIREHLYQHLYQSNPMSQDSLENFPRFQSQSRMQQNRLELLPMLVVIFVLLMLFNHRRKKLEQPD